MESVSPKTERVLRRLKGIKTEIKKEIREQVDKAMPHIRKAVTGDRNLRIRDFRKTAPVVRFADKASFFFGVNTVLLAEMVLLTNPDLFWIVFMVLCPTLILIRLPLYYIQKYHFFTIDFCYYVNVMYVLCIVSHALVQYPTYIPMIQSLIDKTILRDVNTFLLRVLFANTTGPLLSAVWVWKNSAVFHSLDKMTSLFIHIVPALLSFTQRWYTNDTESKFGLHFLMCDDDSKCEMSLMEWFVYPLASYVLWQIFYLFVTELVCRKHIEQNPDVSTSMRWLSADRKNGFNKFCKMEEFDGDTTKTKIVFVTVQFLYTILTYIPVKFCYENFYFHASFLLVTMLKSIWNGASYYIEVFAVRYVRKFKRSKDVDRITPPMTPDSTPSTSPSLVPQEVVASPKIENILLKKEH
eukprot:g6418.t1